MTTDRLTLILSKSSKYPHVSCRCLDEWDVFLDAVNRKAISEELLRFCLRNPDKQFIFISPQVRRNTLFYFYVQVFNCLIFNFLF